MLTSVEMIGMELKVQGIGFRGAADEALDRGPQQQRILQQTQELLRIELRIQ